MDFQMIRVISSPSSSTTGLATLILDMPLLSLHDAFVTAAGQARRSRGYPRYLRSGSTGLGPDGPDQDCLGSTRPAISRPIPRAAKIGTSTSRRLDTSMPALRAGSTRPARAAASIIPATVNVPPLTPRPRSPVRASTATTPPLVIQYGSWPDRRRAAAGRCGIVSAGPVR